MKCGNRPACAAFLMVESAEMLPKVKPRKVAKPVRKAERPDLQTQFEELLHQVWRCESDWRFDDRLDVQLKIRRR